MARASFVLSILVASPGDVPSERDAVVEAINQWNSEHSRQMKLHLEGIRWETQSGTIEEIERLRSKGKQVALYFSNAPLPREFDEAQYRALKHITRNARLTLSGGSSQTRSS